MATELNGQLLRQEAGGAMRVIATGTAPGVFCAVSQDGKRAAYVDASLAIHLVSLEDGRELARRGFDFQQDFRFSPHGLIVFKQGRLELIGGPEGDFTIDLPESRFGPGILGDNSEGHALSADGELVAIASHRGATETTVVDLRSRSIRGVLHHPSGRPQLTFSLDGKQVFAAGMNNGSALSKWRLPVEDLPRLPRWWNFGVLSGSGGTALLVNSSTGRYELSRPFGTVIASGVRTLGLVGSIVGDGPAVAFKAKGSDAVGLRDLEKDRLIWQHRCGHCTEFSVSDDGSRFVQVSLDEGLEVWDTRSDRRIFQDNRRVKVQTMVTISGDGRLLAWNTLDTLIVRDLSSGQEHTVPLDSGVRGLGFSPDSSQLVTVSSSSVTLRETVTGRELWKVSQDASQFVDVKWSPDRRSLILKHGWIATEVLDAATGERLARFPGLSRAVTPVLAELYSPDLRVKAVSAQTTWEIRPVPPPDDRPAAESLAQTLRKTGLEFRGVDLVAAP